MKYHIWTIGCQMNKADSERLESALEQMGLSSTESPREADVVVLNSCVVRQSAEDKVVGMLSSLKRLNSHNPGRVMALMGCMVGPKTDDLKRRFPHVDVFMRPQEFKPLLDLLGERLGIDPEGCVGPLMAKPHVSAYIPIIHGCDKLCAFCIIPYRRGREQSRTIEDIATEVRLLIARGVKEVTLLGQNVDSYGHDLPEKRDLADLLYAVSDVGGLERIRFLTSHPNDMSDRIIRAVADLDKVCEHINLPFQAGDDKVLEAMRRGYTNRDYRSLVEKMRNAIPNVSLSTDVIVGFCGETEEQFQRTYELIRDIRFGKVHVAAFSPREGTIAWRRMSDDVPYEEKRRRLHAIEELQEGIATEINARLLGQTVEVLIEGETRGMAFGRTRNDKLVYLNDGKDHIGQMVKVKIDRTGPWSLQGSIVPEMALVGGR